MPDVSQKPTCGAKVRPSRGGGPCKSTFLGHNGRCRMHGGTSVGGPLKHGRYSKSLGRFREAYEASRADASLTDLREPIAVIDAMAKRLMERTADHDTPEMRRRARKLLDEAREAQRQEKVGECETKLDELAKLLRDGIAEDRSVKALVDMVDRLARRVEGAEQLKLARRNVVNARDMTTILLRILEIAREYMEGQSFARFVSVVNRQVMNGSGTPALEEKAGAGAKGVNAA
jgi:hypothetical protein